MYFKDYPDILKIDPSNANLAKIREIEKERLLREATYQGKLVAKDLILNYIFTNKILVGVALPQMLYPFLLLFHSDNN